MRNVNSLGALAAGLGLMYFFDPERGRIRRAVAGDRVRRRAKKMRHIARVLFKRGRNQMRGLKASVRYQLSSARVDDEQLNAQVRSRLGRLVGHPGAIHTRVRNGCLTLTGPILVSEQKKLLSHLWDLHGVQSIDNRLNVREYPGREPGLQGRPRPVRHSDRGRSLPLLVAGGALACGLLSESRAIQFGALSTAALIAANSYRRSTHGRRIRQDTATDNFVPLDYRPFIKAPPDVLER